MKRFRILALLVACVAFSQIGLSQTCPQGLEYIGRIYADGAQEVKTHNSVLLPPRFRLDKTYQQTTVVAAGGGAGSTLQASEIPAGIQITPSGNKEWAVSEPKLEVVKEENDQVIQRQLSMYLYCSRGSGELAKLEGGCNVQVDVCAKRNQ